MHLKDDCDFAGIQLHEISDRIYTQQLHEAANQILIELLAVVPLKNGKNAFRREGLLILALRAHRVVHVGDAAQHRREIQIRPRDAVRVARAVEAKVMLERHDRRERRNLRRAPKNLRAIDDVALHDHELLVGQLVGLVQDLGRRLHFADVVHERGEAEFAQQRAVDAEPARLGHRENRHVHHVRERVVVVFLQSRQRHQRRAVVHDRLREIVDHRLRRGRVGLRVCARVSHTMLATETASAYMRRMVDASVFSSGTRSSSVTRPTRMVGDSSWAAASFSASPLSVFSRWPNLPANVLSSSSVTWRSKS